MHHRRRPSSPHATTRSRTGLLALLCIAQLMVILDISAVNVALPDMAKDLDIDVVQVGLDQTKADIELSEFVAERRLRKTYN